jgi:hypothetical protein
MNHSEQGLSEARRQHTEAIVAREPWRRTCT